MKGKRWLCALLGALLALSLGLFAACGNTEEEQQTVAVASVTVSPATLSLPGAKALQQNLRSAEINCPTISLKRFARS